MTSWRPTRGKALDLLSRRGIVLLLVAVAIVSLVGVYLYAQSLGPLKLAIGDLTEDYLGRQVETTGKVKTVNEGETGVRFVLQDGLDFSEISIFATLEVFNGVERRDDISLDAQVQVRGELQLYQGDLEIFVTSSSDIVVIRGPPVMVSH